jgi:hypothetical protein
VLLFAPSSPPTLRTEEVAVRLALEWETEVNALDLSRKYTVFNPYIKVWASGPDPAGLRAPH